LRFFSRFALQAAFPLTQVVSRDPKGVFVLLNLLDLLSARIWDDPENCEPGLAAIDSLCLQFCLSDKQLMHNAMHALSGASGLLFMFRVEGAARGEGGGGLAAIDSLCLQFCPIDKQLMHNVMHALSGGSGSSLLYQSMRLLFFFIVFTFALSNFFCLLFCFLFIFT
jgi:hypothetical protein